jgi:hypothetical protein
VVKCQDKPEVEASPSTPSVISTKSMKIALRKDIAYITKVIGDRDSSTREELIDILKELSIIDATISSAEETVLLRGIDRCRGVDGTYSAQILQRKLIESLDQGRHRRFNVLVANRFRIARANEKSVDQKNEPTSPVVAAPAPVKMKKKTWERLLAAKPVAEALPQEETRRSLVSEGSRRVLKKSKKSQNLQNLSLEERTEVLSKLRQEAIEKLEKELEAEELKEMQPAANLNLGEMPEFYQKIRKEKKEKKEEEKVVQRIRLGRVERNVISEALDFRSGPVKMGKCVSYAEWKKEQEKGKEKETKMEGDVGGDEIDLVLGL